ncbi:MAG TPA: Asp23/Gls24 family envelope stress response protein [Gaiellaceae bacterium]|nr:Asp23/Gls24 family envelope stress response protein [Gaiellaceae bacterium]
MTRVLTKAAGGSVRVSEAALAQIVGGAVSSVAGARLRKGRRRLELELADGHARAELEVAVAYGAFLPDVARAVQERVGEALARMCGVDVAAVDVSVVELVR